MIARRRPGHAEGSEGGLPPGARFSRALPRTGNSKPDRGLFDGFAKGVK